ncbi:MAG: GT4 family glycosyltransferase PelF [Eubacteriales bacterium]|nr:GT4 family glycosyltransferase PelF [Eubacteriales bacterium]
MKVCFVVEGCYPYVVGGVSGWINSMIQAFSDVEFIILAIISDRSQSGKFKYEMLPNVSAVYEAYLNDVDWNPGKRRKKIRLNRQQYRELRNLVLNYETDWRILFDFFSYTEFSVDELLMGEDFFKIVRECYDKNYPQVMFSDFLWTMRSIYLPMFLIMKTRIPKADIYHCVSTGYAGILGSIAKYQNICGLLLSEHGIYTREREEEILKAKWVNGIYKNIWIDQFRNMSKICYRSADVVTALYGHARELQIDLGCNPNKIQLTPNGIITQNFEGLPGKTEEDEKYINVGAVLRVAPIKDVKTMIRAFSFAKQRVTNLKLWIMGPMDEDEEYTRECQELVEVLQVKDVVFTGRINVKEYLGRMDFTILTSISEGQPLTILESFAAGKPVIATDVGNCRELIYGEEGDTCGTAGILTHIMNTEEIATAMVQIAEHPDLREQMGACGYQRANQYYRLDQMQNKYYEIYQEILV